MFLLSHRDNLFLGFVDMIMVIAVLPLAAFGALTKRPKDTTSFRLNWGEFRVTVAL